MSRATVRGASLVVDESTDLAPGPVAEPVPRQHRAGSWRSAKAFEVDAVLREVRAAAHAVDVCAGRLLRLMVSVSGWRRFGTRSFGDYVVGDLRQASVRRFQYLVAIDRAICGEGGQAPLPHLGEAWRRGEIRVSQARELIRVIEPDSEARWLQTAARLSVAGLVAEVEAEIQRRERADPGDAIGASGAGAASGDAAASSDEAAASSDEAAREEVWRLKVFSASRAVDDAWQVCVETSRRMAGYDQPLHACVEDLLDEYASGCPVSPVSRPPGETAPDEDDARGWHRAVRWAQEARDDLLPLRRAVREVRLAADPLAGLPEAVSRCEPATPRTPLDPAELDRRIRWVLRVGQNVAWHECRLMRLVADERLHLYLGFTSLKRYAVEALGCTPGEFFAAVRLSRLCDSLPVVAGAFRRGDITAREAFAIGKVATGSTQRAWVARAMSSSLLELKEDVGFVLATGQAGNLPPRRPLQQGEAPVALPVAAADWDGAISHEPAAGRRRQAPAVRICAVETSSAVVVPLARRVEGWYSAFGEHPDLVERRMMEDSGRKRPVVFVAPEQTAARWDRTLAHCRQACVASGRQGPSASQCVAVLLLEFLRVWAHPEALRSSRAYRVFTRDGWRCGVPGCRSRAHLHAHHIIWRSRNGPDAMWNLVTVCAAHHTMIHEGVIRVRGRAPGGLEWAMGVNEAGDVRQRFRNGTRIECDPLWRARARRAGAAEL